MRSRASRIRIAYDPEIAELVDDAHQSGEPFELRWSDVGPSGAQANWDSYRHDSALSVTWQMTEAPRGIVQANILTRFLAPHRDIARKRVTWLYRPIDVARAAAIVQADLRAANFNMTSSERPTARDVVGTRAAMATAEEEANGAGLVNFGMVVTATVTDPSRVADAKAAIENLSSTARLRLRWSTGPARRGRVPTGPAVSYEDDMRDDEFDEQGTALDSTGETPEPDLFYGSVDEFVREYLIKVYRRPVGAQGGMKWAARWWEYPEALSRLDALWRAWEHLRLDPATGMSLWWRDHADHHMPVLLSPSGPFAASNDQNKRGEPLPYEAPVDGLFPDLRRKNR